MKGGRNVVLCGKSLWYQTLPFVMESAFAETTCFSVHQKLLQLLNGEMSWKENSSLLRLWPYQGMKHTVSQNGEFIARYC